MRRTAVMFVLLGFATAPATAHSIAPSFVQTFAIDGHLQGIEAQLTEESQTQ